MNIRTKYSIGDVVYIVHRLYHGDSWRLCSPMPVEEIEIMVSGNTITEQYKCEMIAGFHPADKVFAKKDLSVNHAKELNQQEAAA